MKIVYRNIGQNKGKPRLWIEGEALSTCDFLQGDAWVLVPHAMGLDLVRVRDVKPGEVLDGRRVRKVAGTATRPIIDIAGSSLDPLALFGEMPDRVALVLESNHIAVRRSADVAHLNTAAA